MVLYQKPSWLTAGIETGFHNSDQDPVGGPASAGGLDWVTHRGPFQPQTFSESVKNELMDLFSTVDTAITFKTS